MRLRALLPALLFAFPAAAFAQGTTRELAPGDDVQEALDRLRPGDTLLLANGSWREPLFAQGLKGTAEAPITIQGESRDGVVLDGGVRSFPAKPGDGNWDEAWDYRGRIDLAGCSHVAVRSLTIRNNPSLGLQITESDHVSVEDVLVDGTAHAGMRLDVDGLRVLRCEVTRANLGAVVEGEVVRLEEAISIVGQSTAFEVAANRVHDCFKEGIVIKEQSRDGEVHDNVVERVADVGIYLDECSGVRVDRNRIRAVGYLMVGGRETPAKDHPELSKTEEFGEDAHGVGILLAVGDLGDLSRGELSDVTISRNEVWHCGAAGVMFWDELREHHTGTGTMERVRIVNNVYRDMVWAGIAIDDAREVEVANNVVARCPESIVGNAVERARVSHNLFHEATPVGEHAIEGDPRFVDPEAGDFRLSPGSAAIDRGRDVGLPAKGKPDLGSRESGLD